MRFDYVAPETLEEISNYKKDGGKLFSGGTDLFVKIKAGALRPSLVVDTKKIETPKIECEDGLKIYMNTTYTDVLKSECAKKFDLLMKVLIEVGSPQIRNRGTPVGNTGNASPAGDFLLSTYVYDGKVVVAPSMRVVPITEFVKGPGKIDLSDEEFIYAVSLEPLDGYVTYYEKVGRRNAMVISIASIAVAIKMEGEIIEDARIAYGSVGPTVVRFRDLEEKLIGERPKREIFEAVAKEYSDRVKPISDVRASAEYRKKLVENLLIKAYLNMNL